VAAAASPAAAARSAAAEFGELVMANDDLSQADQDRIAKAVAEAEKTTAGEIYCVLAPEVGDDRSTPLIWATGAALLLPALALLAGFRPEMLSRLFGGWSVGHAAAQDAPSCRPC
jgi:putative membrane protein